MRLTFCYQHVGHYYNARLMAIHSLANVTVIDYGNVSGVAFEEFKGDRPYKKIHLEDSANDWTPLRQALNQALPDILFLPGWGYPYTLSALGWALESGVPVVVISDSTELDKSRNTVLEAVKSRIVRLVSSGLAAGKRSRDYLITLGMAAERIFNGCDVVDNMHFLEGSEVARRNAASFREKLALPQHYFLAVNRLIPEKNLLLLLQAYAGYRKAGAPGDWKLVLVGDGELKGAIVECIAELGIESHVLLAGPKKYEELPAYYGLAGAFILPSVSEPWGLVVNEAMAAGLPVLVSSRCGCVDDLVEEGKNGYTFDPYDIDALTAHLLKIAGGEYDLTSMAEESRRIISRWSVELCAENTLKAAEAALSAPRPRPGLLDKLLLKAARVALSKNL